MDRDAMEMLEERGVLEERPVENEHDEFRLLPSPTMKEVLLWSCSLSRELVAYEAAAWAVVSWQNGAPPWQGFGLTRWDVDDGVLMIWDGDQTAWPALLWTPAGRPFDPDPARALRFLAPTVVHKMLAEDAQDAEWLDLVSPDWGDWLKTRAGQWWAARARGGIASEAPSEADYLAHLLQAEREVRSTLTEHSEALDAVARALLRETALTGPQAVSIMGSAGQPGLLSFV